MLQSMQQTMINM
jgi:hypothetical protein